MDRQSPEYFQSPNGGINALPNGREMLVELTDALQRCLGDFHISQVPSRNVILKPKEEQFEQQNSVSMEQNVESMKALNGPLNWVCFDTFSEMNFNQAPVRALKPLATNKNVFQRMNAFNANTLYNHCAYIANHSCNPGMFRDGF